MAVSADFGVELHLLQIWLSFDQMIKDEPYGSTRSACRKARDLARLGVYAVKVSADAGPVRPWAAAHRAITRDDAAHKHDAGSRRSTTTCMRERAGGFALG